MHLTVVEQSFAKCVVEPQHLKQIPFSLRNVFLSVRLLALKDLHGLRGCGLSCKGQLLFGLLTLFTTRSVSGPVEDTSVLLTEMGFLVLLKLFF